MKGNKMLSKESVNTKKEFESAYYDDTRKNPFRGIKSKKKFIKKSELDISEVNKLINLKLSSERKLEVSRDIFLFSVYTGFPYCELEKLTKENILIIGNNYMIDKVRIATKIPMRQMLVKNAVELVKKYEHDFETEPLNRLFPKQNLQKFNSDLKILQNRAGINNKITSHIGRYTCSQYLCDLSINRELINTMLGWSCEGLRHSIIDYIKSNKMLEDAKNKYDFFLNEHLSKN